MLQWGKISVILWFKQSHSKWRQIPVNQWHQISVNQWCWLPLSQWQPVPLYHRHQIPIRLCHVRPKRWMHHCYRGMIWVQTRLDQIPLVNSGPLKPALSSRAQLVSRRFYSCCLLLFPGIYQRTRAKMLLSHCRASTHLVGLSITVVLWVNTRHLQPTGLMLTQRYQWRTRRWFKCWYRVCTVTVLKKLFSWMVAAEELLPKCGIYGSWEDELFYPDKFWSMDLKDDRWYGSTLEYWLNEQCSTCGVLRTFQVLLKYCYVLWFYNAV